MQLTAAPTDPQHRAILAAALALPGVALAESAPDQGLIGFRVLYYKDYQPSLDRITVTSPALYLLTPIGKQWSLEGSLTADAVSGATPRWHSAVSSASKMDEDRTAGDLKITRYFRRVSIGVGVAASTEHDYDSRTASVETRVSSEDNNTTLQLGAAVNDDALKPWPGASLAREEDKRVNEYIAGLTQVLSPVDIVQFNVTYARQRGYLSDPYKFQDLRPRERTQAAALLRWNHHFRGPGATLRASYRRYSDDWDVDADTFTLEWAQSAGSFVITPGVRFHTQSAARFYVDAVPGSPAPPFTPVDPPYYSADHRLAAFGAATVGLKIALNFARDWTVDFKADYYEARGAWRVGGKGSPGMEPFQAQIYQLGLQRRF